jgi:CHAT domain-containing protein
MWHVNSWRWILVFSWFSFVAGCTASRPQFVATAESWRNALSSGEISEALYFYETLALEAEKTATISLVPQQYWKAATAAYKYASRAAWYKSDLQKAKLYAEKAMAIAEKTNEPTLTLDAIRELMPVYRSVRDFEMASELLNRGFEVLKRVPPNTNAHNNWEAILKRFLGGELNRRQNYLEAANAYSAGIRAAQGWLSRVRQGSPSAGIAWENILALRNGLATAYRLAGKLDDAEEQYQHVFNAIQQWNINYPYEESLYAGRGEIYIQRKELIPALRSFEKSLALAESRRTPAAIRTASVRIGDILRETGKPAEALQYYSKAIQQIESTRELLHSEQHRQSYFEGSFDAYVKLVQVLLAAGRGEEAFGYSERARSRAFLDLLGSKAQLSRLKGGLFEEERTLEERIAAIKARLFGEDDGRTNLAGLGKDLAVAEQAYNSFLAKVRGQDKEQASLMSVQPLTLKQVQELIDPAQTLIEYFVTDTEVLVWVVEKDKLNFQRVAISKNDLTKQVRALREMISNPSDARKLNDVSGSLYRQLVQPLIPHITGKELIIVPHDVLHYLPFQALLGSDGRYLVEKYPISYLSSASLLQFVKEKRTAGRDKVLAFGNPDLGDPDKDLEYAEVEAQEVKAIYPESSVFVRKEATEQKSKALSNNHDILHFATHAQLNEDDPLSSAVLLAKDGNEDGRLEVREIFGMALKANLVVLSGCETGLGKLSTGDELVGLTRAFIYAGTPSVVASLWKVDDSSTAYLMSSFYRNLKMMTKVEALREAQLQLIRGDVRSDLFARRGIGGVGKLGEVPTAKSPSQDSISVSTSHPYFWAPFILVGDGK